MSLSDFETICKLGEGSFAEVYKVKRLIDSQYYALKQVKLALLSDKEKLNALNEIRILASLNHPNIVGYKEAFLDKESNSLCIVMEYADGGDLLSKIKEHKKNSTQFPESEIWDILIQLVRGIKALHDTKILHRDLKSANIFICNDGCVKIGDMNISKIIKNDLAQTMVGTPFYASPEIWLYQPYDSKSDIWSLGCVLYELTMLTPPFIASDLKSLYRKVTSGRYPPISNGYSPDLVNIIRRMLCVKPENRPSCNRLIKMPDVLKHIELREVPYSAKLLGTIKLKNGFSALPGKLPPANYNSFRPTYFGKTARLALNVSPHRMLEDDKIMNIYFRRSIKHKQSLPPLDRKLEISKFRMLTINSTIK